MTTTARPRPRPRPRPALSPVHRRRRAVAALLAVLVVLGGLALAARLLVWDSGWFAVEEVRVTGLAVVPEADVLAAAAVVPGGALADVDTLGTAERVAALPGVAEVTVGRSWPHVVTVAVTERTAVAVTTTSQGDLPVDATGVVYPAPPPPGLPRLRLGAPGPDDPATRAALDVLAALPEPLRAQVLTAGVVRSGGVPQVTLGLTDGREVLFGTSGRAAEKASVLVALLTLEGRVYDVSSPNLPTVRS